MTQKIFKLKKIREEKRREKNLVMDETDGGQP